MRQALASGVMQRLGIRSTTRMSDEQMDSDIDSELTPTTIAADYETLINECFQVLGLTPDIVRISVRPVGFSPAGVEIYAAFIKVLRWEPNVIQMLNRLPYFEKKIDKRIRLSNLLRYSGFAGLWFRTPATVEGFATAVH
ncbi:hypothetical protein [Hydrogenophaga sp.]|uniref:hypothetical protein n=1 Tax=Hydrogenophaga sp. TaxID=1904254 RepID=UPI0016A2A7AC|nr:hypothetical protein [Hydrogenophaga sp.]NIN26400.1 hypothetical protein [Hydrogenophaga sp.]NIN31275.1 hypothetical protein [Hydrogenophaga sp.]NIN55330.1 hypothetical protein [Hydrogenophaga sp.]NIQ60858.1 hypothetical protein [Hydrogenophaga sp.]